MRSCLLDQAGDDRDRSDSADDRAYLHAKQIRKREEAEVEAERGRVADESLPVRETADAEEPIVLQAAGLDGNETLFQWAFEDDAFEQRIEGTADIFSDEFRAEQRARTRGQICSGVVEVWWRYAFVRFLNYTCLLMFRALAYCCI